MILTEETKNKYDITLEQLNLDIAQSFIEFHRFMKGCNKLIKSVDNFQEVAKEFNKNITEVKFDRAKLKYFPDTLQGLSDVPLIKTH